MFLPKKYKNKGIGNINKIGDDFIKKIDELTEGKLKKGFVSKVNMCMAFTFYYRDKKELEKCTLDDLAEFFGNPNTVCECFFGTLEEMFPGIFKKDYTQVPWGRIFQRKDGVFQLMCGSWIDDHIVSLVKEEFDLKNVQFEILIDEHWEIGHGWFEDYGF